MNKIFRQAAKSKIIVNAHNVNNGISFINAKAEQDQLEDFFYINEPDTKKAISTIISLCEERLKKYGNYDFFRDIQVLTPTKKGALGTKELNKKLQEELNKVDKSKQERVYGEQIYRVGDKVMQTKNDYDIYWERENETGTGIFNGEIGTVAQIDNEQKQIRIEFDDAKTAWYSSSILDEIEHSYSITIHKAQRQ